MPSPKVGLLMVKKRPPRWAMPTPRQRDARWRGCDHPAVCRSRFGLHKRIAIEYSRGYYKERDTFWKPGTVDIYLNSPPQSTPARSP